MPSMVVVSIGFGGIVESPVVVFSLFIKFCKHAIGLKIDTDVTPWVTRQFQSVDNYPVLLDPTLVAQIDYFDLKIFFSTVKQLNLVKPHAAGNFIEVCFRRRRVPDDHSSLTLQGYNTVIDDRPYYRAMCDHILPFVFVVVLFGNHVGLNKDRFTRLDEPTQRVPARG